MNFILNDTHNAEYNENLGMQELSKSQVFGFDIEKINWAIAEKKQECNNWAIFNLILIFAALICVLFQLILAYKIMKKTKWGRKI